MMKVSLATLQHLEPISTLSNEQIQDLTEQTLIERIAEGVQLFKEGDNDKKAVYLLSGNVLLTSEHGDKQTISGSAEGARRPLAAGQPRRASAVTLSAVEIIRIDNDLLDSMMTWSQFANIESEVVMSEEGIITIDKGSWLKVMYRSPTFKNLPLANIEKLLDRMDPVRVKAGEVIIRQGDVGDYFYMIQEGNALVTRQADDEVELAELIEGSSFGEAALISDRPRNATVSMMSEGVLLRLSKDDFNTLLKEPMLQWISFERAKAKVGPKVRWLDVRLASEFAHAHLADALNIPLPDLHRRSREMDRSVSYICYCDSGRRSSAAVFILKQYGLEAEVLQGGMQTVSDSELVKGT